MKVHGVVACLVRWIELARLIKWFRSEGTWYDDE